MVYVENKHKIASHNQLYAQGKKSYRMKMNHFGDLLHHECVALMNGYKAHNHSLPLRGSHHMPPPREVALPRTRASVGPAGPSLRPELWKVSTPGRRASSCRCRSRTWSTAPRNSATTAATVALWTTRSSTSKSTAALTPKPAILTSALTDSATSTNPTWAPKTPASWISPWATEQTARPARTTGSSRTPGARTGATRATSTWPGTRIMRVALLPRPPILWCRGLDPTILWCRSLEPCNSRDSVMNKDDYPLV